MSVMGSIGSTIVVLGLRMSICPVVVIHLNHCRERLLPIHGQPLSFVFVYWLFHCFVALNVYFVTLVECMVVVNHCLYTSI